MQSTQAVLLTVEIRSAAQLDDAFPTLARGRAEGLLVPPDTVFRTYRQRIAELAAAARLPAIYDNPRPRRGWGLDQLRPQAAGELSPVSDLRRQDLQGRKAQRRTCRLTRWPTKIENKMNGTK